MIPYEIKEFILHTGCINCEYNKGRYEKIYVSDGSLLESKMIKDMSFGCNQATDCNVSFDKRVKCKVTQYSCIMKELYFYVDGILQARRYVVHGKYKGQKMVEVE